MLCKIKKHAMFKLIRYYYIFLNIKMNTSGLLHWNRYTKFYAMVQSIRHYKNDHFSTSHAFNVFLAIRPMNVKCQKCSIWVHLLPQKYLEPLLFYDFTSLCYFAFL